MKTDFDNLSLDELLTLRKQVNESLEKQKDNVIDEILEKMANIGITISDLQAAQTPEKPASTAKPKYRNPANHDQVWSGRGKPPVWMRTHLDAGGDKEDFLID